MTWNRKDIKIAAINILFVFIGVPLIMVLMFVVLDILAGRS